MNKDKLASRGTGSSSRFLPKRSLNINHLDSDIAAKIKRALDTAPQDRNWRAFIVAMVDKFKYSQHEVEGFGLAVNHPSGSPTGKLWNDLASRGFKVKDLIHYLDVLRWEPLLYDLKPYEPIKVLLDPPEKRKIYVGETLILETRAIGFPYPRYQWFRSDYSIQGAMEEVLKIDNITSADEGSYCCRIHNSADLDTFVFTKNTAVLVRGNPQQGGWPAESPVHVVVSSTENVRSPQIVSETRESSICVHTGKPFILQCKAVGTGALEYRWLKNGQLQPCISEDYMVQRASVVDSGSYECLVKSPYGETKSKLFLVTIVVDSTVVSAASPKPSLISQPPKSVYQNIGSSLDIIAQPKSCSIERGGSALFTCQVLGEPPLNYQWYKEGRLIPGENSDHLAIRMVNSYDQEGCFQCRVWNGTSEVLSSGACLRLDSGPQSSPDNTRVSKFTATDKIALLIGNYDYISADPLKAPKTDVLILAELFKALDFKVVSLLNLTLGEMEAAVTEFCHLLQGEGGGIYGVFYFCGHGIEDNGQCYLVPQDAPTGYSASNCLCAQKVLRQLQHQNPAVCTMILDCCRIVPENPPEDQLFSHLPLPIGNTVYLYATTQGMKAWEYEEEPNGVLVKHLQRHLCQRKSIEAIFANVREDISADPKLRDVQIPEIKTNLRDPNRSLADKIVYTGYTEMFSKRQMRWKNAHVKPSDCSVYIKPLGVTITVEYQADFSNVMSIYLTVSETGVTRDCHAWVVNLPPTLSVMEHPCCVSLNPIRTKTVLQDIQKLKEPLAFNIKLQYSVSNSLEMLAFEHGPIEVGLPLISTLQLWKGDVDMKGPNSQHREPIEQGDDFHFTDPPYANVPHDYINLPLHYENIPQSSIVQRT